MNRRKLSPLDRLLDNADRALRTVFVGASSSFRESPAAGVEEAELSESEQRHVAGLMRVNHAGEIAAQALYHGQATTARLDAVRQSMQTAAEEENDHLAWCEQRLDELGDRTSRLDPFWYAGSFALGALAGLVGDRWSLGFVAETEKQVVAHLESHLELLPESDRRSRAIVETMKEDEAKHGDLAMAAGGAMLPAPIRGLMRMTSKLLTTTAYRF